MILTPEQSTQIHEDEETELCQESMTAFVNDLKQIYKSNLQMSDICFSITAKIRGRWVTAIKMPQSREVKIIGTKERCEDGGQENHQD